MRNRNSKLAPVLRAMDAFTAPAPAETQPECALADCHETAELRDHLIDDGDIPDEDDEHGYNCICPDCKRNYPERFWGDGEDGGCSHE